nr:hypothetical protein B0A51_10832 [Rachicladosporium sp. CCFEE 5018]
MAGDDPTWKAAALANLERARLSNGRLGVKKSRVGCLTCRSRKQKCDETRPHCQRCQHAGRACGGYADSQDDASTGLSDPSKALTQLKLNQRERQIFDYFIGFTAPRVAGTSLDREFWTSRMLQVCHHEPFALNAIIAIATLHRHPQYLKRFAVELESDPNATREEKLRARTCGDPFGNEIMDPQHLAALMYYNRAIAAVKTSLSAGAMNATLALLSCFLFLTIEIFRDSLLSALVLGKQCAQLLKKADVNDPLVRVVQSCLNRLSVLASTFGQTQAMDILDEAPEDWTKTERYETVGDARAALFKIMGHSQHFASKATELIANRTDGAQPGPWLGRVFSTETAFQKESYGNVVPYEEPTTGLRSDPTRLEQVYPIKPSLPPGDLVDLDQNMRVYESLSCIPGLYHHGTPGITPSNVFDVLNEERHYHLGQLRQWYHVFTRTLSSLANTEADIVSNLLLCYHVSVIWLSTRLQPNRMSIDRYTDHFREIIYHAKIYNRARSVESSELTMETGAIPSLYFVTMNCRVPSLRREALQLLRAGPSKEGIWGAICTAQLAATIIWLEERELGLPMPYEPLPTPLPPDFDAHLPREELRVHHYRILKNNRDLKFYVKTTRYFTDTTRYRHMYETTMPIGSDRFRAEDMLASAVNLDVPDMELMEGPPAWTV